MFPVHTKRTWSNDKEGVEDGDTMPIVQQTGSPR